MTGDIETYLNSLSEDILIININSLTPANYSSHCYLPPPGGR